MGGFRGTVSTFGIPHTCAFFAPHVLALPKCTRNNSPSHLRVMRWGPVKGRCSPHFAKPSKKPLKIRFVMNTAMDSMRVPLWIYTWIFVICLTTRTKFIAKYRQSARINLWAIILITVTRRNEQTYQGDLTNTNSKSDETVKVRCEGIMICSVMCIS